jgi:hypothetical protein
MNGTERAYALRLERLKREGKIEDYRFESDCINLGVRCTYRPDFIVILNDGKGYEIHETKAMWPKRTRRVVAGKLETKIKWRVGWREDAHIKFKWAVKERTNVFVLAALYAVDGTWHLDEFNGESATITPAERKAKRSGIHSRISATGLTTSRRPTRITSGRSPASGSPTKPGRPRRSGG